MTIVPREGAAGEAAGEPFDDASVCWDIGMGVVGVFLWVGGPKQGLPQRLQPDPIGVAYSLGGPLASFV